MKIEKQMVQSNGAIASHPKSLLGPLWIGPPGK